MEKIRYKAEYLGGHAAFPKSMKCEFALYADTLEIPQMPLRIEYKDIESVQSQSAEKLSVGRFLLVGVLAFAWKKKKAYMVLSYKDEGGNVQDMVFDVKKIEEVQPLIYRRMLQAKSPR